MRKIIICLLSLSVFFGCSSLRFRKDDSVPMKITKSLVRIPLCVLSIGRSEINYLAERRIEARTKAFDEKCKSWVGHDVRDLIHSWGPPSQIFDDGKGGKYIVYRENRSYVSGGYASSNGSVDMFGDLNIRTTYHPPKVRQWSVYRMFRVNRYGEITYYKWKGL